MFLQSIFMNQFRYLSLLFVAIVHLKRIQGPPLHFNSRIKTEYENLLASCLYILASSVDI